MAITYDKIGNYSFLQLQGDLDPEGQTAETITRPGVDGIAIRKLGVRGEQTSLFGIAMVKTSAQAKTLLANYKAVQGTIVTITKNEQSFTDYYVWAVGDFQRQEIATPAGGVLADGSAPSTSGAHWLVFSRWLVQYVG